MSFNLSKFQNLLTLEKSFNEPIRQKSKYHTGDQFPLELPYPFGPSPPRY